MDRYKSLAKNTAIFAFGTFGSKILSFIMVFFYSRAMAADEFGALDIIINSGSLLLPICMLGIQNALIRFGLDNNYKKSDVFTTGIISVLLGFSIISLATPAIVKIEDIRPYILYLLAHVLMSSLRHICSYFVRAIGKSKLYAADGIFTTFVTCSLTIIFLLPLRMGIRGYLLAIILADLCSVIFLCLKARLWQFVKFKGLQFSLIRQMLLFSLPLIPTSLLWWVVNVSDRYFVRYMIDASANGLYSMAYKVPTILSLVSHIFLDAWQISAVEENKSDSRNKFYSSIFSSFQGAIFIVATFIIAFSKLITVILLDSSYYPSWQYIPFLVLSTVFSCFVVFLGNIYLAEKKSVATLITTLLAAVLNIILNAVLIPIPSLAANGAAIATFISYFACFLVRAIDIKHRNRDITLSGKMVTLNLSVMLLQVFIMLLEPPFWYIYQALCVGVIVALNFKMLLATVKKIIKK